MIELFDSHCHIQSADGQGGERTTSELWNKSKGLNRQTLVAEAADAGVSRMICVGCDLPDSRLAIKTADRFEAVWASIGLHPHAAKNYQGREEKLSNFSKLATRSRVVAIGECGLDYYYLRSPRQAQIEILRFQIELALQNQLPIIFHVRQAYDDFWPIFDSYTGITGVLHSFTDSQANLAMALKRGLYIGVNGIATFTKSSQQQAMYRSIPPKNLLLETDAPFLAPTPHRGQVNSPKRTRDVAVFLTGERGVSLEQLAEITTDNARRLFGV